MICVDYQDSTSSRLSTMNKGLRACARLALRCNPFYRGGARLATLRAMDTLTPKGQLTLLKLRRGPLCLVYVDDWCGRILYYTGDYDRRITWICRRLLRPGDCFVDIGANFGEVGFYAAQFVGPSGCVHFFEPQQELANLIRISAKLNGFHHVHVHELALSDRDGIADLFVPRRHTGMGSLSVREGVDCPIDVLRVPTRHAGASLAELRLPRIRVLKLDVEGHEDRILHAAKDYFRLQKPSAIIFECHGQAQPFFERAVVKHIVSLGYEVFQLRQKIFLRVQFKRLQDNCRIESGYDFLALSTDYEDRDVYRLLGLV